MDLESGSQAEDAFRGSRPEILHSHVYGNTGVEKFGISSAKTVAGIEIRTGGIANIEAQARIKTAPFIAIKVVFGKGPQVPRGGTGNGNQVELRSARHMIDKKITDGWTEKQGTLAAGSLIGGVSAQQPGAFFRLP